MKILVINGDCIQVNTSANLCHLAYIKGLVDSGHEVTLLSADGRDYDLDPAMKIPECVSCHTYYGVSLYEKLAIRKKKQKKDPPIVSNRQNESGEKKRKSITQVCKEKVLSLYGVHGIYATFVRKAQKFYSNEEYDYVLSLSTPVTSHLLAHNLIQSGHIHCRYWIQIWEDPWYSDAFGFNRRPEILAEERRLLSFAERVCYVSPITLANQKKLFPESAGKMYWQPVPSYYDENSLSNTIIHQTIYGYFGNYYSVARNLTPFYEAAKKSGISAFICGDSNNAYPSTDTICVFPRLSLEKIRPMEENTSVLVFLCNRQGGQIPGKIYQYSATDKTILFILDGTEEEKSELKNYFSQFNRYVFCENTEEDIIRAIRLIESRDLGNISNCPLHDFEPKKIISRVLEGI